MVLNAEQNGMCYNLRFVVPKAYKSLFTKNSKLNNKMGNSQISWFPSECIKYHGFSQSELLNLV